MMSAKIVSGQDRPDGFDVTCKAVEKSNRQVTSVVLAEEPHGKVRKRERKRDKRENFG